MKSVDLNPISVPPWSPSTAKWGRNDVFSLNWLNTLIFEGDSRTANSDESKTSRSQVLRRTIYCAMPGPCKWHILHHHKWTQTGHSAHAWDFVGTDRSCQVPTVSGKRSPSWISYSEGMDLTFTVCRPLRPYNFATGIHGSDRVFPTNFEHQCAFTVPHATLDPLGSNSPYSFKLVVRYLRRYVVLCHIHQNIFRTRNHHRKLWVKTYCGNVMRMSNECLHTTFRLKSQILTSLSSASEKVALTAEIFNVIYTLRVLQGELGYCLTDHTLMVDCEAEVRVFAWIKHGLHHIMGCPSNTCLHAQSFPNPEFNKHIIRTCWRYGEIGCMDIQRM